MSETVILQLFGWQGCPSHHHFKHLHLQVLDEPLDHLATGVPCYGNEVSLEVLVLDFSHCLTGVNRGLYWGLFSTVFSLVL